MAWFNFFCADGSGYWTQPKTCCKGRTQVELGSTFREMQDFVRKIRITLEISPLSRSFNIFQLFPAFSERHSKLDFKSEGIQPCSGSGRHASWPRPCCKIRRHGCWIKLRPHRLCYGLSLIAMRAIVAPLKMGLRRISYLVSAKDHMNSDIFGSCSPITQIMVGASHIREGLPWNHPVCLPIKNFECKMFFGCNFVWMFLQLNLQVQTISWPSSTIHEPIDLINLKPRQQKLMPARWKVLVRPMLDNKD